MAKYDGIYLYDIYIDSRYNIDDEDIRFVKKYGYYLIDNPDNPDVTSTDHEYFIIHDDLFDRVLETDHNSDILLKVINKEVSLTSINDNGTDSRSKLMNRSEIVSSIHQLKRKRQKKVHVYSQKSIDRFVLIVVNPPPKLTDQEKYSISTSFGYYSQGLGNMARPIST